MEKASKELDGIQILRGLAALAVVIHHALEISNGSAGRFSPDWLTTSGAAGVDVFFVISGFIMVYSSFKPGRPPMAPITFLSRRFLRIFPLYWVCLLAITLLCLLGFLKGLRPTPITFAQSVVLLPWNPLLNVSWTLSYEIFFYLVFAVSLTFAARLATCLSTTAVIIALIAAAPYVDLPFLENPIMLEFCFGLLLALIPFQPRQKPAIVAVGIISVVVAMIAPMFTPHEKTAGLEGWARLAAWGIPSFFIVAASLTVSTPKTFAGRLSLALGNASYAIYLTHVFGMIAYGWLIKSTFLGSLNQVPMVMGVVIVCCAIGVAAHLFIERPMNDLLKGRRPFGAFSATGRGSG